jgi:large subunit ribosomal protein L15
MPLQRRVPKFGFKNPNKVVFKVLNLDDLQKLSEAHKATTMDVNFFINHGLVSKKNKVKILGRGELSGQLNISAHAFSDTAKQVIEKEGGTISLVS